MSEAFEQYARGIRTLPPVLNLLALSPGALDSGARLAHPNIARLLDGLSLRVGAACLVMGLLVEDATAIDVYYQSRTPREIGGK